MKKLFLLLLVLAGIRAAAQQDSIIKKTLSAYDSYEGTMDEDVYVYTIIRNPTSGTYTTRKTKVTRFAPGKLDSIRVSNDSVYTYASGVRTFVHKLSSGGGGDVASVFGRTGAVTAQSDDYSAFYLPLSHAASGVTSSKITNWDLAFGFGNHAGLYPATQRFLDSIASVKGMIASGGISVDGAPTDGSTNPVSSNGVYDAVQLLQPKESGKGLSANDYTTTEKNKLAGIAAGATVNATDAQLRDRSTHTGTQPASSISDFQSQVSANTDVTANTSARHSHSNKTLLDTYTQTESNLADAVGKKHSHSNSVALDAVSGTNTGDETGTGIKAKLEALTGTNRLSASAIKDLPTGGEGSLPSMTGMENTLLSTDGTNAKWIAGSSWNIANHGAVGDSATDNTTALQALFDFIPPYSTVFVPNGSFLFTTLNITKPVRIESAVAPMFTYGGFSIGSQLISTSKNGNALYVDADYVQLHNLTVAMYDTAGQTTGSLVYLKKGIGFKALNCYFTGGYDDINIENAYSWQITGCTITGMARYGIYARDLAIPDEGDAVISFNWIYPKRRNANSLIRQESGGGIKVIGNKFNNSKLADGGPWHQDFCYSATFQTGHTVLAIFTSNSFENYKVSAIKIVPNGNFGGMVVVTGNQLSSYNNGTTDIDFSASGFPSAVISGNVGAGGTGKTFVNYAGVTGGLTIASNSTTDYTTLPPIFLQTNHNNVTRFHIDGEGNILVPMISGGGTVDATIIDGSTNAVAGNAVYDALQGKQAAINLTTTGTSGAATFDGTNLNIPQYSGAGGGSGDILSTLLSSEVSITGATALTSSAFGKMHVCTGTTADYTVGLPAAAGNAGKFIGFRMASALTVMVTLDGNSAETIDAAVERIMWKNEVAILYCDGTTWTKIAGKSIPMVCVVAPSANSASLGEGNRTIISLNATITDAAGMADNGNNRVIIKRPGNYLVTPIARFEALSANTARLIAFASKNGSSDDFLHQGEGSGLSGSIPFIGVGSIATYAAGDNLRMGVFFGGGAASAIVRGNSTTENSTLSIEEKVSW